MQARGRGRPPSPSRSRRNTARSSRVVIYIAGGFDSTDSPTKVAYRYDPARDHWERIADLPEPRHHMPLAVVNDTLYAVGGLEGGQRFVGTTNLWIYRPGRNAWESRAPLPAPRGASAVGVVGGKLVVVGGFGAHRDLLDSTRSTIQPRTDGPTHADPRPQRDHSHGAGRQRRALCDRRDGR